jgi:uroporphyrinogen-III synthase
MSTNGLNGITVVGFESRMSDETASLIEKFGGEPLPAPSMQEAPMDEHEAVFDFAEELLDGTFDLVYFNTGVGTRMVFETLETRYDFDVALSKTVVVARSPKPGSELKKHGVQIDVKAPEPNTWREVLETLTSHSKTAPLEGKHIAIHEYGQPNEELNEALKAKGAEITSVPIYRWKLPDDLQPLKNGIRALIGGEAQAALFTSRRQIDHVLQVAAEEGWEDALRTAFEDALVASVGPVTTEALEENGIAVDFEPDRPKLAILIRGMAEYAPSYFQTHTE